MFKIGLVAKGCARKQKEKKPATSTFLGILKRKQKENPRSSNGIGGCFVILIIAGFFFGIFVVTIAIATQKLPH
ncbi:hypothetical protein ACLOBI_05040 [Limosilactobacillus fermentum]|uniref:hypothetical protein n=1 Tax=Limosilactobacillus fermentum TaxID=1613 RepID=UPI00143DF48B|nr:hypothetical protein [Limosilactobacillus fermentum]